MTKVTSNIQVMKKCLTKTTKWKFTQIKAKRTFNSNKKDKTYIKKISLQTKIPMNSQTILKSSLKTIKLSFNKL